MIELEEEIMTTEEVVAIAIDQDHNTMIGDEMEAVTVCSSFCLSYCKQFILGGGRRGGRGRGRGDRGGGRGRERGRGGGRGGKRDRPEPVDWDELDCPGRGEVEKIKAMNELSYNPIKTKFCTLENSEQRRAGKLTDNAYISIMFNLLQYERNMMELQLSGIPMN